LAKRRAAYAAIRDTPEFKRARSETHKKRWNHPNGRAIAAQKAYESANREKIREYRSSWARKKYREDPEFRARSIDRKKERRRSDDLRMRERDQANHRNAVAREELRDSYVAKCISIRTRLSRAQIPPELIEMKRLQIQIRRELHRRNTNA
jgi:hypothetical protein